MVQKKTQRILEELFKNQTDMAEKLDTAAARISDYLSGKTKSFSGKVIQKLIMDYNIDPDWLFSETDEPIRFRNKIQDKEPKKYLEIIERLNTMQEELIIYQKKDIESLKKTKNTLIDAS
jgi:transcriptional regulator with XRE-family HTH domain